MLVEVSFFSDTKYRRATRQNNCNNIIIPYKKLRRNAFLFHELFQLVDGLSHHHFSLFLLAFASFIDASQTINQASAFSKRALAHDSGPVQIAKADATIQLVKVAKFFHFHDFAAQRFGFFSPLFFDFDSLVHFFLDGVFPSRHAIAPVRER
jgi:hypothetical protein